MDDNEDIDYAVELRRLGAKDPLRPMRARWFLDADGSNRAPVLNIYPPDGGSIVRTLGVGVNFLGLWKEPQVNYYFDSNEIGKTWEQIAAHAYGQVLRQRALAERLGRVGIRREPEPYILDGTEPNSVKRSMVLNFDELDMLLDLAKVPQSDLDLLK
jgi:hypothetical protein